MRPATLSWPGVTAGGGNEVRRLLIALAAPLLYICVLPMLLLDLVISIYHQVCFPIFEIPYVRRSDHFVFDRGHLPYLNVRDRLNCVYCSYANGLFSFVTEIAARTEQRWCPIKHESFIARPHSRYSLFFNYGDADSYLRKVDLVCHDFRDLMKPPRRHR